MKIIETNDENKIKIFINNKINEKIKYLTNNFDYEISGWLIGNISSKDNNIKINDIIFPHQKVGTSSVDTDDNSLIELRKEYGNKCLEIIGHWHSHHKMGSSFSITDEEFIDKDFKLESHKERKIRFYLITTRENGNSNRLYLKINDDYLFISNLEIYIYENENNDELKKFKDKLINEKVKIDNKYNFSSIYTRNYYPQIENNYVSENINFGMTKFSNKKNRKNRKNKLNKLNKYKDENIIDNMDKSIVEYNKYQMCEMCGDDVTHILFDINEPKICYKCFDRGVKWE